MKQRMQILPGVFLTAVQTDKFKTGCVSLNFLRPLRHEEAAANALLPSVLLRGCKGYPDIRTISERLDELYGASVGALIRKRGEVQTVGFYADFVEDELVGEPVFEPVMDFVRQTLLEPVSENGCFCGDYFEGEKYNLANAIASAVNDKRTYATMQMLKTMCAGEPYGIARLGEMEDLEKLDAQALYAHYRAVLASSRAELFYMGRQTPEQAAQVLQRALCALPREKSVQTGTAVRTEAKPVRTVRERMDVTQGKLSMGFCTGCTMKDENYPAMLMLNTIFGGGISSKLFVHVREEMSLCYYAGSALDAHKGVMLVSSGIEFDKFETARDEILHQLEACREGEISDYEFESARGYLLSDLKAGMDSPGRLDEFYLSRSLQGLDETMEDLAGRIAAVTKQQVMDAAKQVQLDTVYFLEGVQA